MLLLFIQVIFVTITVLQSLVWCCYYFVSIVVRYRHYCDLRNWEQPVISCLGEDGIPVSRSPAGVEASESTAAEESAQQQRSNISEGLPVGAEISAVTTALVQED